MTDQLFSLPSGCLLEGARPPPDVPPRNPTMSRLNGRITGNPADLADFEPSCLVRTPSGNFYVPSGEREDSVLSSLYTKYLKLKLKNPLIGVLYGLSKI